MTADVYLCDDPSARDAFLPFALSRPLAELRYGAFLPRERWSAALGRAVAGQLAAAHLSDFAEPGSPPVVDRPPPATILAMPKSVRMARTCSSPASE